MTLDVTLEIFLTGEKLKRLKMKNNTYLNPWKTLSNKKFYEDKYLRMEVDQIRHLSGKEHPHTAVRFNVYGVAVLPIFSDGTVCLVGQYRYVLERYTWELIRGSDPLALCPIDTARRELAEEIGAETDSWLQLPTLTASPGITSELAPCFIAWNLNMVGRRPEPHETLHLKRIPFNDAVESVFTGEIIDAASAVLLLSAAEMARRYKLPNDLLDLIRIGGLSFEN